MLTDDFESPTAQPLGKCTQISHHQFSFAALQNRWQVKLVSFVVSGERVHQQIHLKAQGPFDAIWIATHPNLSCRQCIKAPTGNAIEDNNEPSVAGTTL